MGSVAFEDWIIMQPEFSAFIMPELGLLEYVKLLGKPVIEPTVIEDNATEPEDDGVNSWMTVE